MADKSKIEWCDATWNPIVGCSIQSKGCTNCYAMKMAARIEKMQRSKYDDWRLDVSNIGTPEGSSIAPFDSPYKGLTQNVNGNIVWTGKVNLASDQALFKPLQWKNPRRIFVNSMGDLFHENVPTEWIDKVFAIMALCPQHTFIILTKNPKKMKDYIDNNRHNGCGLDRQLGTELRPLLEIAIKKGVRFAPFALPLPNIWLGVSVENQETAEERIPILLDTPAVIRFISAEPLLGEINLMRLSQDFDDGMGFFVDNCLNGKRFNQEYGDYDNESPKLDWVIVGGESGSNARPMKPDWVRKIRDQCKSANVPFFFKQWGEWHPDALYFTDTSGNCPPPCMKIGKKKAGNLLGGKQYLEFPKIAEQNNAE